MNYDSDPIAKALAGRQPLLYLQSAEEDRVVRRLERLSRDLLHGAPLHSWTCTRGFEDDFGGGDTRDPVIAVQAIVRQGGPGLFVMKDLSAFLDRPEVARALRDAHYALSNSRYAVIVILSPEIVIPPTLEKNIGLVRVPPPDLDELAALVQEVVSDYTDKRLPAEWLADLSLSLKGFTLDEARQLLHRVLTSGGLSRQALLDALSAAKKEAVAGSTLEFVSHRVDLEAVGGLFVLKDWILKRRSLFSAQTVEAGLPVPRGMLLMGISGCGKSLCAKLVAGTWGAPLFRLDMNSIYSSAVGNPEAVFRRALDTVESVAPAVLWIDEIENGLGTAEGPGSGTGSRIFSSFLTWMQEKPPLVFVAATANRIEALPAELIRKGRFDQVFFCDLPREAERREVFEIHIRNNLADPEGFDLDRLVADTEEWNAAEIEQAVVAGRIDAAKEGRPLATADILAQTRTLVPLSRTMHEQVKFIRDWAWDRATPASGRREIAFD